MQKWLETIAGLLILFAALVTVGPGQAAELVPCSPEVASRAPNAPIVSPISEKLATDEVGLTFVGHATFLIQSAAGIRIATDYNDDIRPKEIPDIATMNHAHPTHYTDNPDPRIAYVLRGWNPAGGTIHYDLRVSDVRVRNVPTNIRSGSSGTAYGGNSIFVFEIAGLCIAHLSHLHHTLTPEQLQALGHVDVLLVPADGVLTLDLDGMMEVIAAIHAPMVIPMHYFNRPTLERFLTRARDRYAVIFSEDPAVILSHESLPKKPTVLVLPGR